MLTATLPVPVMVPFQTELAPALKTRDEPLVKFVVTKALLMTWLAALRVRVLPDEMVNELAKVMLPELVPCVWSLVVLMVMLFCASKFKSVADVM